MAVLRVPMDGRSLELHPLQCHSLTPIVQFELAENRNILVRKIHL